MAYSYAVLTLTDSGLDITAANLDKIVKATGNTVVGQLSALFERALEGKNVSDFFACGGSGSAAPAATAGGAAPAAEVEEVKEEEAEDVDMGGMFGDEDF